MKITTADNRHALSGHVHRTEEFAIRAGPQMMHILSTLYKDPVAAIVREYGSNMIDAYVGHDEPFRAPKIILPSSLNPQIQFVDYGKGMSYEMAFDVYRIYGESTKNEDNDNIGGFGLGCKTAFAYTNSWAVESRYNGVKYSFAASKNDQGIPSFILVDESPTDEPNGVTVTVPVKQKDVHHFHVQVASFAEFFPMELDIVGLTRENRVNPAVFHKTSEYQIREQKGCLRAVVGPIAYELEEEFVEKCWPWPVKKNYYGYSKLGWDTKYTSMKHFDLFFEIGTVDLVPSRDALMGTDRTYETVKAKIESAFNDAVEVLGKDLDTSTPFAFQRSLQKAAVVLDRTLFESSVIDSTGEPYSNGFSYGEQDCFDHIESQYSFTLHRKTPDVVINYHMEPSNINEKSIVIYINDWGRGALGQIKEAHGNQAVFIIVFDKDTTKDQIVEWMGGISEDRIFYVTDEFELEPQQRKQTNKQGVGLLRGVVHTFAPSKNHLPWSLARSWSRHADVIPEGTFYYLPVDRYDVMKSWDGAGSLERYDVDELWSAAVALGLVKEDDRLWLLRKSLQKKMKKNPDAHNLWDAVQAGVKKLDGMVEYLTYEAQRKIKDSALSEYPEMQLINEYPQITFPAELQKMHKDLGLDTTININDISSDPKVIAKIKSLSNVAKKMGMGEGVMSIHDLQTQVHTIRAKYPIIGLYAHVKKELTPGNWDWRNTFGYNNDKVKFDWPTLFTASFNSANN